MVLGNSNGNNKGKKYLKDEKRDIVYAKQAEQFNDWISTNYKTLTLFLQEKRIFDEDIFNTTYLNIYKNILFTGLELTSYKSYFMRAYITNLIQNKAKESRFCELLPNTDREDIETEYIIEIEEKQRKLESDIMNYIYLKYDLREFELFKMYMNLKPAVNYNTLAAMTGLKFHNIQSVISTIKKDIQNNEEFSKRRKELL